MKRDMDYTIHVFVVNQTLPFYMGDLGKVGRNYWDCVYELFKKTPIPLNILRFWCNRHLSIAQSLFYQL